MYHKIKASLNCLKYKNLIIDEIYFNDNFENGNTSLNIFVASVSLCQYSITKCYITLLFNLENVCLKITASNSVITFDYSLR